MVDIIYINKSISNEFKKWSRINSEIFVINDAISYFYKNLNTGDLDSKKDSFRRLHFFKVKKYYFYIKMYNDFIKKTSTNEKI